MSKTNEELLFEFRARVLELDPRYVVKADLDNFIPYITFNLEEDDIWDEDGQVCDEADIWLTDEYLQHLQDYGILEAIKRLKKKLEKEVKKYNTKVVEKELLK